MKIPYTLTQVDTRNPDAVCAVVVAIGEELYGNEACSDQVRELFQEVTDIFEGRFAYFQKMDTVYHNLEHTLQATLCWVRLLRNYQLYSERAKITAEFFQMGLVAVLLHDIGYLKEEHDEHGTGAKFTFVHERRSCELAQLYLARRNWERPAIFAVQHMISCTGPHAVINAIPFRHRSEKVLGQMLCTADYLGQMSDPSYLEKLPILFQEFEESDNYRGIPQERRLFSSVQELVRQTPKFWFTDVLPRLEYDCGGLFHYLADPYPDGANPYLMEVERNLDRVRALDGPPVQTDNA